MRLNENLIYNNERDHVIVKDPTSGTVVRLGNEAVTLLRLLEENNFDIHKAVAGLARVTGQGIEHSKVKQFLNKAVELNLVVSDEDSPSPEYLKWRRGDILSKRLMNPEKTLAPLVHWLACKKYIIHPILTILTVGFAIPTAIAVTMYRPAINGHWLFAVSLLLLISVIHEIGHGIVCKYFGGAVTGFGVGITCWVVPYLWSELGDIWFFKPLRARIVSLLGGIWLEFFAASAGITIMLAVGMTSYIPPVLLVLSIRFLLDSFPVYSDSSLVRRELSRKMRYLVLHCLVWLGLTTGFVHWMGVF